LWLPVAEKSSVVAKEAEAKAPAPVKNLTVLVVDDDPLVLTNMAAMLDDLGHTVFEAASALDALAILRRESTIQLVLTDQAMRSSDRNHSPHRRPRRAPCVGSAAIVSVVSAAAFMSRS
jgi:CheY-like chemotaxis protein